MGNPARSTFGRRGARRGVLGAALAALMSVALLAVTTPTATQAAVPGVELRPLTTSADRRIVDDLGRDVLLRGANVNSLGRYWQGVPSLPATIPVSDADWDAMAAHGFSVIRLIVTWSRVEPTRGVIDDAYLDQVAAYVDAAAEHGMYTVIDMHQDAYSDAIATTDPASCPPGTSPARGWDGAPAWATITDGLSTCLLSGDRNSSPAVTRAWNAFYDDEDGIRTAFAQAWGAIAARFAHRPEVAGYDLLNEPEVSRPAAELTPLYEALLHDVVTEIRAAETAAGGFAHLVFVEPAIPAADPSRGLVIPDPDRIGLGIDGVVASAHNYAESISLGGLDLTIEDMSNVISSIATSMGLPVWIGEYGFWNTDDATLAKVRRYATDEDAKAQGGAWWQWRQSCGDPHSVAWSGGTVVSPAGEATHLNRMQCPDNTDVGLNEDFLSVLGRAYPRATPGRIATLVSDPDTGTFSLTATAAATDVGQRLVVWTPTAASDTHRIRVEGLVDVVSTDVPGGRIITGEVGVEGTYRLEIGAFPDPTDTTAAPTSAVPTHVTAPPSSTTRPPSTSGPGPSAPGVAAPPAPAVPGDPRYTG